MRSVCTPSRVSSVMDMGFANQALAVEFIGENRGKLAKKVYGVPGEIDREIAPPSSWPPWGVKIDTRAPLQKKYLSSWEVGT